MKPLQAPKLFAGTSTPPGRGALLRVNASTIVELYRAVVASGRWWLIPMVSVLLLASLLLAVVAALEYYAPFVYTIF